MKNLITKNHDELKKVIGTVRNKMLIYLGNRNNFFRYDILI